MRVHIAAPTITDTTTLTSVLTELETDYTTGDWGDLPEQSVDMDAAVVVLPAADTPDIENLLVEAGIAVGQGIPVLIVTERDVPDALLRSTQVVRLEAAALRAEALKFHLSLFLQRIGKGVRTDEEAARLPLLTSTDLRNFHERLEEVRAQGRNRWQSYEDLVHSIFTSAGADIVAPRDRTDRGFDFAVALPRLTQNFGPLVVEVKTSSSPRILRESARKLAGIVMREHLGLGLLLFDQTERSTSVSVPTVPMVITMSFDELLSKLEREPLERALIRARNEAVHRL
ncbi:hypothetical protein [Amycolatopsis thermoflava]|uniref:hypothetical protein n=1 Tax=Amycolatopsis thermoflava TaxID=84480 RepID=UPI0012F8A23E|nr:hypothetical protein [Amycolatopsis thermoflava]